MIGIILTGIILSVTQIVGKRFIYQWMRTNRWVKLYLARTLYLAWLLWGVSIFFWLFKERLEQASWSYPIVILLMMITLWLLFKNFWLGWRWTFQYSLKEDIPLLWQGKAFRVEQLKTNAMVITDGEQHIEMLYTVAESLVVANNDGAKGKKKKYYKANFVLAPQFSEQHGVELKIKKLLLQSPWSIPSIPPKVILDKSGEEPAVFLEVPAISPEKAKKMVEIVREKYGLS